MHLWNKTTVIVPSALGRGVSAAPGGKGVSGIPSTRLSATREEPPHLRQQIHEAEKASGATTCLVYRSYECAACIRSEPQDAKSRSYISYCAVVYLNNHDTSHDKRSRGQRWCSSRQLPVSRRPSPHSSGNRNDGGHKDRLRSLSIACPFSRGTFHLHPLVRLSSSFAAPLRLPCASPRFPRAQFRPQRNQDTVAPCVVCAGCPVSLQATQTSTNPSQHATHL